jgi:hypothetical protein
MRCFDKIATIYNQRSVAMKKVSQIALIGALACAFAGSAMAQAGGGGGPKTDESKPAVSPKEPVHLPHLKHHKKSGTGGTTLHKEDKASHLKGASAANAASALGTNDKGQPQ